MYKVFVFGLIYSKCLIRVGVVVIVIIIIIFISVLDGKKVLEIFKYRSG